MKIAFDISPLSTGHKFRGTGFYTLHLKNALEKYFPENEYTFFEDQKEIPKNVDIIHYPYFDPFSLSIPLKNRNKTIVTVLDLTPILFPQAFPAGIKGNVKWQIQKLALRHSKGIITDSYSAKEDIKRLVGVPEKKISVTYLAAGEAFKQVTIEKLQVKNLREKYHLPEKFALYVGDVTWNKNVPRIMEAAIQVDIPLVMAGKALVNKDYDTSNVWNKDLQRAQQLAEKHKNIIMLGFVSDEDLVTLYNCATVFVMPSLYEGFGLPILEAMACGCPVITSREGSLPEVAGDAAYVVDAKNTQAIASGIKEVFSSEKMQKSLSLKGVEQVTNFSWKKTAEQTLKAYENYLAK